MLTLVTEGVGTVIEWVGITVNALLQPDSPLKALGPLFAIGISISAILLGVKIVKSMVWGS